MGNEEIYLKNLEQDAEQLQKQGKGSLYNPLLEANRIKNNFDCFLENYDPPTQEAKFEERERYLKINERANIALIKCRNNILSKGSMIHDYEKKGKQKKEEALEILQNLIDITKEEIQRIQTIKGELRDEKSLMLQKREILIAVIAAIIASALTALGFILT